MYHLLLLLYLVTSYWNEISYETYKFQSN